MPWKVEALAETLRGDVRIDGVKAVVLLAFRTESAAAEGTGNATVLRVLISKDDEVLVRTLNIELGMEESEGWVTLEYWKVTADVNHSNI